MTGYLDRLAARVAAPARGLAPRPRSRYEDTEGAAAPAFDTIETTTEPRNEVLDQAADGRPLAPPPRPAEPAVATALADTVRRPDGHGVAAIPPERSAAPVPPAPVVATARPGATAIADERIVAPAPAAREQSPVDAVAGHDVPRPMGVVVERAAATTARVEVADEDDGPADLIVDATPPSRVSAARRPRGRTAAVDAPAPVVVEVTIGRVEIRGTREPARAAAPLSAAAPALTDYLRERHGGR